MPSLREPTPSDQQRFEVLLQALQGDTYSPEGTRLLGAFLADPEVPAELAYQAGCMVESVLLRAMAAGPEAMAEAHELLGV